MIGRRKFLAVAGGGLLFAGGGRVFPVSPARRPSVVLVLVDQLRRDYADRWMPRVTAAGREGVFFERMRSAAPWTYPSVLSIVSGLYPYQHGANGHRFEDVLSHFHADVPTLQKLLKAEGYSTAAFITNPFLMDWNLFHVGFDHFDQNFVNGIGNLRWRDDKKFFSRRMYSNSVNDAVRRHFSKRGPSGPEYTYIHYIDVHGPWTDGVPFARSYESAIEYLDGKIMEMYEFFNERYAGNLLFVFTADHGRAFDQDEVIGEKSPWRRTKKSPHDFNIKVPAMFLPTSALPASGRVVQEGCSHLDLLPTLLELTNTPPPMKTPGRSLVPVMRDDSFRVEDRLVYAEASAFNYLADCVVQGKSKYVRYFDPQSERLLSCRVFDHESDPNELAPSLVAAPQVDPLFALAKSHQPVFEPKFAHLSEDNLNDLRALGYMN